MIFLKFLHLSFNIFYSSSRFIFKFADSFLISFLGLFQISPYFEHIFCKLFNAYILFKQLLGQLAYLFFHICIVLFAKCYYTMSSGFLELSFIFSLFDLIVPFQLHLQNLISQNIVFRDKLFQISTMLKN